MHISNKTKFWPIHLPKTNQITNSIRPHVVFSAHMHISRTLTYPPMHISALTQNAVVEYDLNDDMAQHQDRKYLEIGVPTCSYRMGVPGIGYGMAVIGE